MLEVVIILKALTEVAAFALLGQAVLYLFAGAKRDKNVPYQILRIVTSPVFRIARLIAPGVVLDRHVWLLTPLIVGALWVLLTYLKISLVLQGG